MYAQPKPQGANVHPMLMASFIAFYAASFVGFVCYNTYHEILWYRMAVSANASGVVLALVGLLPVLIDWIVSPSQFGSYKMAAWNHAMSITALILFSLNLYFTVAAWNSPPAYTEYAMYLTGCGVLATMAAGFFAWKQAQQDNIYANPGFEQEGWELGH